MMNAIAMTTMMMLMIMVLWASGAVEAAQYTVGESNGWGLGTDFDKWATQYTFHVGDDLYFPYAAGEHVVLLVREEDYRSCNVGNAIASDNGSGDMLITLVSAETYYFICGVPGHCEQGLRLAIKVIESSSSPEGPNPPSYDNTPPTSSSSSSSSPSSSSSSSNDNHHNYYPPPAASSNYNYPPPQLPSSSTSNIPSSSSSSSPSSPSSPSSSSAAASSYYINNPTFRPYSAAAAITSSAHLMITTLLVVAVSAAFVLMS